MVWILSIHLGLESVGFVTWDFGYCPRWNRLGNPVISRELLKHSASGTLGIALSRHVRTNLGCYGTFVTRAFGYYTTWDKIELPGMSTSKTLLVYMFFFFFLTFVKHLPAQAMDPGLNSWWLPAFHFPLSHPHDINPITFLFLLGYLQNLSSLTWLCPQRCRNELKTLESHSDLIFVACTRFVGLYRWW